MSADLLVDLQAAVNRCGAVLVFADVELQGTETAIIVHNMASAQRKPCITVKFEKSYVLAGWILAVQPTRNSVIDVSTEVLF